MPIQIRIRFGIKTMLILSQILPQVLHWMENQNLFYFQFFLSFSLLSNVSEFQYFGQQIQFPGEKMLFSNFFICLEFIPIRIGRTQPDLDPDQQHCSIVDGMIVHCNESHAPQNFLNRWSPNLTLCWRRARGSSLCTTTWSISSLGKGRPQPPQATRRKRPSKKK